MFNFRVNFWTKHKHCNYDYHRVIIAWQTAVKQKAQDDEMHVCLCVC